MAEVTMGGIPSNPFDDLKSLRIDQTALNVGAARKLITTIPVRKPGKQDFFRVHQSEAYRITAGLIEIKETNETYFVVPSVISELSESEYHLATLFTIVNRQKVLSVWPVKVPRADGKQNEWHTSAAEAAGRAMTNWIRLAANMSLGAYEISEAIASYGDPIWPSLTFSEILKIAFKGKLIDSPDHLVIQQLRGLA